MMFYKTMNYYLFQKKLSFNYNYEVEIIIIKYKNNIYLYY